MKNSSQEKKMTYFVIENEQKDGIRIIFTVEITEDQTQVSKKNLIKKFEIKEEAEKFFTKMFEKSKNTYGVKRFYQLQRLSSKRLFIIRKLNRQNRLLRDSYRRRNSQEQ